MPQNLRTQLTFALRKLHPSDVKLVVAAMGAEDYVAANVAKMDAIAALIEWVDNEERWEDLEVLLVQMQEGATAQPQRLFCVPLPRNVYFTGREDHLHRLHTALRSEQIVAMVGLGGIGKTQTALEYAYRYAEDYHSIFWTQADTEEALNNGYRTFATELHLPDRMASEVERVRKAVGAWLNQSPHWLLILDNVEDLEKTQLFLPTAPKGAILLTSRDRNLDSLQIRLPHELRRFQPEEAFQFLMKRTERAEKVSEAEQQAARVLAEELDYLPLALEQAGAYLKQVREATFQDYLTRFHNHRLALVQGRGGFATTWNTSIQKVATTWDISIQKVQEESEATEELLKVCAFLAPEAIPEEIFTDGRRYHAPILAWVLEEAFADPLLYAELLSPATRYALLEHNAEQRTLSMHRLVQEAMRLRLNETTQSAYVGRIVNAVNEVTPDVEVSEWSQYKRLLAHQRICAHYIQQYAIQTQSAARLLHQTAAYLKTQARYRDARPLYEQALDIRLHLWGRENLETAQTLNHLGVLFFAQKDYDTATQYLQQALSIFRQVLEPDHLETAECLQDMGNLCQAKGNDAEALAFYQQALAIREKAAGPDTPPTAYTLHQLAALHHQRGDTQQALQLYQRAVGIFEQILGQEHPDTATCLCGLATVYATQQDYEQALSLLERTLDIQERIMGEHPHTGETCAHLARLYRNRGENAQAQDYQLRADTIQQMHQERNRPDYQ